MSVDRIKPMGEGMLEYDRWPNVSDATIDEETFKRLIAAALSEDPAKQLELEDWLSWQVDIGGLSCDIARSFTCMPLH